MEYFHQLKIKKRSLISLLLFSSIYYLFSLIQPTIIENIIEYKISNIYIILGFIVMYGSIIYGLYMKKTIIGNKTYIDASYRFIEKLIGLPLKFSG